MGGDANSTFADPRFVSTSLTNPDLHLQKNSPALNTGDPAMAVTPDETDLDGHARLTGARRDIGADEMPGYDAWLATAFPANASATTTASTADPDGDSISNVLEYLFGTNPLVRNTPAGPTSGCTLVAGKCHRSLTWTRPLTAVGVDVVMESSNSLAANSWTTVTPVEVSKLVIGSSETVTWRHPASFDDATRLFVRLRCQVSPNKVHIPH